MADLSWLRAHWHWASHDELIAEIHRLDQLAVGCGARDHTNAPQEVRHYSAIPFPARLDTGEQPVVWTNVLDNVTCVPCLREMVARFSTTGAPPVPPVRSDKAALREPDE